VETIKSCVCLDQKVFSDHATSLLTITTVATYFSFREVKISLAIGNNVSARSLLILQYTSTVTIISTIVSVYFFSLVLWVIVPESFSDASDDQDRGFFKLSSELLWEKRRRSILF
jgi:hypothetical protein